MIYSRFPSRTTVWQKLPLLWKLAVIAVILIYCIALFTAWYGAIIGFTGYWYPILLTPAWLGGMTLLLMILFEKTRY